MKKTSFFYVLYAYYLLVIDGENSMKNIINYFYDIYPDKIYEKNGVIYFFVDEVKYYFVEFRRNIEDLNFLVEITNHLYMSGTKIHTFVENKSNAYFVTYNKENYVLLKVNCEETEEIDLFDIIKFNNLVSTTKGNILSKNDWSARWSAQVDSYEKQIGEYNTEYKSLVSHFDYYVGLAENAIAYLNNIEEKEENKIVNLSHKKIYLPLNEGMLYNPLNLLFDSFVRDIAEYIKINFFAGKLNMDEVDKVINSYNLSLADAKLLYARLLYPTYYFDLFDKVIEGVKKESEFLKMAERSDEYEYFLYDFYQILKKGYNLEEIEWVVNKY